MIRPCLLCGAPTDCSIAGHAAYTHTTTRYKIEGVFSLPLCKGCMDRLIAEDICEEEATDMYEEVVRQVCEPAGRCM